MYDPSGNAREKADDIVSFVEERPPEHIAEIVHRFISLRTPARLAHDYRFHALPDACTYVVLDRRDPRVCGVTRLHTTSHELNLGRDFHFTNIRLLPGVWTGHADVGMVDTPYGGNLPLVEFAERLVEREPTTERPVLVELVELLSAQGLVRPNPTTRRIFEHIDDIHSVADMARAAGLSPRQLQRTLKQSTGFAPHDFLKVVRLQQALRSSDHSSYADQAHFIRSFRSATGYTPGQFGRKFDVRIVQSSPRPPDLRSKLHES